MSDPAREQMDRFEIDAFLESQQTGILALADADDAYAIPLSYVYEAGETTVYFRLGYAPGSQKKRFVEATEQVTFAVYDRTDEGWKSVLMQGRLNELSHDSLDSAILEVAQGLDIPYFQVHDRPAKDIQFTIVELEASSLSGIVAGEH